MKLAIILSVTALLAWWLSAYDSRVTGENRAADFRRRVIRCGVTLVLVSFAVAGMSFLFIPVTAILAVLWAGCGSELLARGFHSLVDSTDSRAVDRNALARELDRLSALVQQDRNEEAIRLCTMLRNSAEGSALAIEAMSFKAYEQMFSDERLRASPALNEVYAMVEQKRFAEAEFRLHRSLVWEPRDPAINLLMVRLYARELHQADKAYALMDKLTKRAWFPPGLLEYMRHMVGQSLRPESPERKSKVGVESLLVDRKPAPETENPVEDRAASVADLLRSGRLGTAIEILEKRVSQRSGDFEAWLMLAEAHGQYCCNIDRARDTVRQIETNPAFTAEQVREAKAKLQQWQERQPNGLAVR